MLDNYDAIKDLSIKDIRKTLIDEVNKSNNFKLFEIDLDLFNFAIFLSISILYVLLMIFIHLKYLLGHKSLIRSLEVSWFPFFNDKLSLFVTILIVIMLPVMVLSTLYIKFFDALSVSSLILSIPINFISLYIGFYIIQFIISIRNLTNESISTGD